MSNIRQSAFKSRLFQWLFATELEEMRLRVEHEFKKRTLREIEDKKKAKVRAVEARSTVAEAVEMNKAAGEIAAKVVPFPKSELEESKKRFTKTYGEK